MFKKLACLATAGLLAGLILVTGSASAASAQTSPLPNLPAAKARLSNLLGDVSSILAQGLPQGPNVYATIDSSTPVTTSAKSHETVKVANVSYNCSGLFLPINGLDGPIKLTITITDSSGVTGVRQISKPVCDGRNHSNNNTSFSYVTASGGTVFGYQGTVVEQVDLSACDITGCNNWSWAAVVSLVQPCTFSDAGNGSTINTTAGATFTDSLGDTYLVNGDCTITRQ